jgi:YVTN family beta-propeller protein
VYIAQCYSPGDVAVIDARDATLVGFIPVGPRPFLVISNPLNDRLYCVQEGGAVNGSVSVIDPDSDAVVRTIQMGTTLTVACLNYQMNRLYVGDVYGVVRVLDCSEDTIVHTVNVGDGTEDLLWNAANNCVYSVSSNDARVTVIDCVRDSVVASISVGTDPQYLCLSPQRNKVYCASVEGRMVTVIDAATNLPVDTIRAVNWPEDLCYNSRDDKLYCANYDGFSVTVVSCANDSVVAVKEVGFDPRTLSYDSLNNRISCATQADSSVWVIDGATNEVVRKVNVGATPTSLLWTPEQNLTFTSNWSDASVSVLRDSMPGLEETPSVEVRDAKPTPTVVRGVLRAGDRRQNTGYRAELLDAAGRKVMELHAGANDVSRLSPGVYFVRQATGDYSGTEKLVLQR